MGSNQQPFRPGMAQGPPQAGQTGQGTIIMQSKALWKHMDCYVKCFMRYCPVDHSCEFLFVCPINSRNISPIFFHVQGRMHMDIT